jgi:hypothetical protein
VRDFEDVDLEDIAGLRVVNGDRAGERVDAVAIDLDKFFGGHAGTDLRPAGIVAFAADGVAGVDSQARWQGAIPARVCWIGRKEVFGHCGAR